MQRFSRAYSWGKPAYSWIIAKPQNLFLAVFGALMFLGPGLTSLLVYPLPLDQWIINGTLLSQFAAGMALVLVIRKRCGWLSFWDSLAVAAQICLAVATLYMCLAIPTGLPHVGHAGAVTLGWMGGLAVVALVCAWGIFRNDWWGYYGELVFLTVVMAAVWMSPGSAEPHSGHRSSVSFSPYLGAFQCVFLLSSLYMGLLRRGRQRWKARFTPAGP
ncbi:MAG TPA: hypothetical protein VG820_03505 [Fimbriimonadaceae bacterium]|nr:hypothetical protein [Fimbriimonadaceae bacterium]